MQALTDGNQFYAGCNNCRFYFSIWFLLSFFYLVTERAREKGVSISVITIKGNYIISK
jgi:hypothetical protein